MLDWKTVPVPNGGEITRFVERVKHRTTDVIPRGDWEIVIPPGGFKTVQLCSDLKPESISAIMRGEKEIYFIVRLLYSDRFSDSYFTQNVYVADQSDPDELSLMNFYSYNESG